MAELAFTQLRPHAPESTRRTWLKGVRRLLEYLEQFDGSTWQQRWQAADLNGENAAPVRILGRPDSRYDGHDLTAGLSVVFGMRIIQPSLAAFRVNKFTRYPEMFQLLQSDPQLNAYFDAVEARAELRRIHRNRARFDIACALTTQGIALQHLTPPALLHYSLECRRLGTVVGANGNGSSFAAVTAWSTLHEHGHFPQETPPTLRTFIYRGQKTIPELIDQYQIRHVGVRQLLIDYVTRRRAENDYATIEGLARHLAGSFWAVVERLNPAQEDLLIAPHLYDQWRAEIQFHGNDSVSGRRRKDPESILLAVRGLYMDLHSWAVEEPGQWGRWVASCPVRPADLRGFGRRRQRINERMADRIRTRQPLLPILVADVETRLEHLSGLLAVAAAVPLGAPFEYAGRRYTRSDSREDHREVRDGDPKIRVSDSDGTSLNVSIAEDIAFWAWATVEVLRHSGIRVEELCELTHLSVRQYQRPNGEVIALLVIAPSKSDRERVIPMSAPLFHAIAQIIRRHTRHSRTVPMVTRYDPHERTWSAPMPFLFQRVIGPVRGSIAPGTILNGLRRRCTELATTHPQFADLHITPHDFRRLFATEVVNSGLPIHIGAALLGHVNLQTTQGYVAVFNEDIVRHYQEFLDHRRRQRPEAEYRNLNGGEWVEFEQHFDTRKVELGACARPYGTGCQHEHACIRCPMLQVNPKMLPRLDELETDLLIRLRRARAEQWLGEMEGINLTLTFLRAKRDEAKRLTNRPAVALGFPRVGNQSVTRP